MTTQKPVALEVAKELEFCIAKWGKQDSITFHAYEAVKAIRRQHAEIEALNAQVSELKMQIHYAKMQTTEIQKAWCGTAMHDAVVGVRERQKIKKLHTDNQRLLTAIHEAHTHIKDAAYTLAFKTLDAARAA